MGARRKNAMSLLRRASSPIRNFGKQKNALLFEIVFQHLELEADFVDKYNKQKCWVKWIRTSKDGQTKKKVTIADGRANLMGEKIPIQCTCHYTDEEGYEPKNLVLEVYTRSKGDKTEMIGRTELNLTQYALQEAYEDLTFHIEDDDDAHVAELTVNINCSFIEGKGQQPKGARLNSPRRPNPNGYDSDDNRRDQAGAKANSSPRPRIGMQEASGTPRSSAAKGAHKLARGDLDDMDMSASDPTSSARDSAFPKSPQTTDGKPDYTAKFVSRQVRSRRPGGGSNILPDGEV